MNFNKRIRTVLYDDQRFSSGEIELIHTPAFQRLYDLHQLGLTDRIFVDASHSRLHHVIGVVEQAGNLMTAIARNLRKTPQLEFKYSDPKSGQTACMKARPFASLVIKRIPAARIMGLLHDLTHAPYGHTLEDEIHLVQEKHDEPSRQADAFYRVSIQFFGWLDLNAGFKSYSPSNEEKVHHAKLREYLNAPELVDSPKDNEFIQFVAKLAANLISTADERKKNQPFLRMGKNDLITFAKDMAFAMRALLFLEAAHKPTVKKHLVPDDEYEFDSLFRQIFDALEVTPIESDIFLPHRDAFTLDVIGNTICADLLDYAKRDSVSAGLKLDYDASRIIENFTLVSFEEEKGTEIEGDDEHGMAHPFDNVCIRTAISIFGHKLRLDVPGELLNLLQVRYYVYERMLFHPTKCIAGAMLGSAIQFIGWSELPNHFRFTGDAVFLHDVADAARIVQGYLKDIDPQKLLDDKTVNEFEIIISKFASTSVIESSRLLISSRVVRIKDVKARLSRLCLLQPFKQVAEHLLKNLGKLDYIEDQVVTEEIAAKFIAECSPEEKEDAKQIVTHLLPRVGKIIEEITAGLHLLSRLASRKYYKSVFRLLPGTLSGFDADAVAKTFLNSRRRFLAEREIENRAGISLGSIVIHCPRREGPAKIANILITSQIEGKREPVRLREIGKLHDVDNVFEKHQLAIEALQDMYRSTWRLVVSVSPPHTINWKTISKVAGEVLSEIVRKGQIAGEPAKNDPYMVREIELSLQATDRNGDGRVFRILNEDGDETEISEDRFSFLQQLGNVIENHDVFRDVFQKGVGSLFGQLPYPEALERLDSILNAKIKTRTRNGSAEKQTVSKKLEQDIVEKPVVSEPSEIPVISSDADEHEDVAIEIVMSEVDRVMNFYRPYVREAALTELASLKEQFQVELDDSRVSRAIIVNRLRELIPPLMPSERVECNRAEAKKLSSPLLNVLKKS